MGGAVTIAYPLTLLLDWHRTTLQSTAVIPSEDAAGFDYKDAVLAGKWEDWKDKLGGLSARVQTLDNSHWSPVKHRAVLDSETYEQTGVWWLQTVPG